MEFGHVFWEKTDKMLDVSGCGLGPFVGQVLWSGLQLLLIVQAAKMKWSICLNLKLVNTVATLADFATMYQGTWLEVILMLHQVKVMVCCQCLTVTVQ
jgi:hypothetical protein